MNLPPVNLSQCEASQAQGEVCLVVLVGLPGCGKTSLCQQYTTLARARGVSCLHVCYDSLVPLSAQADMVDQPGRWKVERERIVGAVDSLLARRSRRGMGNKGEQELQTDEGEEEDNPYTKLIDPDEESLKAERLTILIDDNNYLSSMRQRYHQLGRRHRCGFAQLHLACPPSLAVTLNSRRQEGDRVPCDVIQRMAGKLEPPDPLHNTWEQFSFSLPVQEDVSPNLELVWSVLQAAAASPVLPVEQAGPGQEERARDRVACTASVVHQADKQLRRLVHSRLTAVRAAGDSDKAKMKEEGGRLYRVKGELLEDLRTGHTRQLAS